MGKDNRAGREVIDPGALKFTEDAPPPLVSSGPGYSPYAAIVRTLQENPGKWGTFAGASRKAENIHRRFPGIERRADTDKDVLWLRYVTPEIVAAEAIAAADLNGVDAAIAKDKVTEAARDAGLKSAKYNEDNTLKVTEFLVTAMQDAAKVACVMLRQEHVTDKGDEK